MVEDEAKLAGIIQRGLRTQGLAADVAGSGEDAGLPVVENVPKLPPSEAGMPAADGSADGQPVEGSASPRLGK